jgi:hypothetical protein
MPKLQLKRNRSTLSQMRRRAVRPLVEGLEARVLLFTDTGDQWTFDSRITYSFMPDGTSVGGTQSVLFQTLNARFATAKWEGQIEQAASLWENVTNVNLALVSDGGEPVGTSGDQQDDPRFGDIRIGAVPLPSGVLAETLLPPPANGGTDAGDILFNSNINWQINNDFDLMTVAAHEFGHALGLGESSVSTAVMYGTYNGIKQALTSDDISGIQSIYGTRSFDQFNSGGNRNSNIFTAANINSFITSNAQIAIPNLDITTGAQAEWFFVDVPSTTTGTMKVTVQSSNLSSLTPTLAVFTSSASEVGLVSATDTFGATISISTSVSSGQGYYIRVTSVNGESPVGNYGLLINFGSQAQAPIAPPNTVVAPKADQGGGTENDNAPVGGLIGLELGSITGLFPSTGNNDNWWEQLLASASALAASGESDSTQMVASLMTWVDQNTLNAILPPSTIQAVDEALGQLVSNN